MNARLVNRSGLPLAAALALSLTGASPAAAEDDPSLSEGSAQFLRHCAVCHGALARGDGPLGEMLTQRPPDLTRLSAENGGEFPFWTVYEMIDGRAMPLAHGTREMPVYGLEWAGSDQFSETYARGRIMEIMLYLRSLQSP